MIISIDIDGTWTADPGLWECLAINARERGHKVIIATGRKGPSDDLKRMAIPSWIPIIYCGNEPKRQACLKAGYAVNVWVDDMPEMIGQSLILPDNSDDL